MTKLTIELPDPMSQQLQAKGISLQQLIKIILQWLKLYPVKLLLSEAIPKQRNDAKPYAKTNRYKQYTYFRSWTDHYRSSLRV